MSISIIFGKFAKSRFIRAYNLSSSKFNSLIIAKRKYVFDLNILIILNSPGCIFYS